MHRDADADMKRTTVETRALRDRMTIRITERWWEVVQAEARLTPKEACDLALRLLRWAATYDETARCAMEALQGD